MVNNEAKISVLSDVSGLLKDLQSVADKIAEIKKDKADLGGSSKGYDNSGSISAINQEIAGVD
jgi:hypothetical protein